MKNDFFLRYFLLVSLHSYHKKLIFIISFVVLIYLFVLMFNLLNLFIFDFKNVINLILKFYMIILINLLCINYSIS